MDLGTLGFWGCEISKVSMGVSSLFVGLVVYLSIWLTLWLLWLYFLFIGEVVLPRLLEEEDE